MGVLGEGVGNESEGSSKWKDLDRMVVGTERRAGTETGFSGYEHER